MKTPIPDSYWVVPGRLLAGEYPGHYRSDDARAKVRLFLNAGVDFFVDLTEADELEPYAALLAEEQGRAIGYERHPIPDLGTVSEAATRAIVDRVDALLDAGHVVYVHCWGGIGRTGTVVGCWLVRHGQSGDEALQTIRRLRAHTSKIDRDSPETREQRARVRHWPRGS